MSGSVTTAMMHSGGRGKTMLITFEGGEGSGKTTCLRSVATRLREHGLTVHTFKEPGSTPIGYRIRDLLLSPSTVTSDSLTPTTELLLFCAARAQFVETVLSPLMTRLPRAVILCDRFADSTIAYQLYGRGLPWHDVMAAVRMSTQHITPDATLFFDVPPAVALTRLPEKGRNRLDNETLTFHERVHRGYWMMMMQEDTAHVPTRWRVIDATQTAARVAEDAFDCVWQMAHH